MRTIRVTFADGNVIETSINGTDEEILAYYMNNAFNFGDTAECPRDNLQYASKIEFDI